MPFELEAGDSAQFVELDLKQFRGRTPIELFAETRFPMIGDLPGFRFIAQHNEGIAGFRHSRTSRK